MSEPQPPLVGLRRAPQQARSRARVDAVIAALVGLVAEVDQPSQLTTGDVADRAGIPPGSLYEYFEDLPSIVDAAVGRLLARHDEILRDLAVTPPKSLRRLVDVLFDSYLRLYAEDPGFLALRNSTLFQARHRAWLDAHVAAFVRTVAEHSTALGIIADRPDTAERLDLVFALGDAVLQAALRNGPPGDPMVLEEGRAVLQYAARRIVNAAG